MDQARNTPFYEEVCTALIAMFGQIHPTDSDGDWPVQVGERMLYMRACDGPTPNLLVFTRVAQHVGADCLGELNLLNASALFARFLRAPDGALFVSQRTQGQVTAASIAQALESVAGCANQCGPLLEAVYGAPATSGSA